MRTGREYLSGLDITAAGGKSFPDRKDSTTPNVSKTPVVGMGSRKSTQKTVAGTLFPGQTLLLTPLLYTKYTPSNPKHRYYGIGGKQLGSYSLRTIKASYRPATPNYMLNDLQEFKMNFCTVFMFIHHLKKAGKC